MSNSKNVNLRNSIIKNNRDLELKLRDSYDNINDGYNDMTEPVRKGPKYHKAFSPDLKSIKYNMQENAYPDFGFHDPLNFELRDGETGDEASENRSYSVWHYMYNYI